MVIHDTRKPNHHTTTENVWEKQTNNPPKKTTSDLEVKTQFLPKQGKQNRKGIFISSVNPLILCVEQQNLIIAHS